MQHIVGMIASVLVVLRAKAQRPCNTLDVGRKFRWNAVVRNLDNERDTNCRLGGNWDTVGVRRRRVGPGQRAQELHGRGGRRRRERPRRRVANAGAAVT